METFKSNKICSVPQCKNRANENVSLYIFPKNEVLRKRWITIFKIGKVLPKTACACSVHFSEDDFFYQDESTSRRRLKRTAIPAFNLPKRVADTPTRSPVKRMRCERKKRAAHRQAMREVFRANKTIRENNSAVVISDERDVWAAEALLNLSEKSPNVANIKTDSKAVQTGLLTITSKVTVMDIIKTNKDLNALTGLATFEFLDRIVRSSEIIETSSTSCTLPLCDRVVLTFMKLKLNITFLSLSVFFSISSTTAIIYFVKTVKTLYEVFNSFVEFPSKENIETNMPKGFINFQDVRAVIDCTEILVSRHKCLTCRIKSYSHYKKGHTVKFMIGITPGGLISHCSKVYGGKASDKFIFLQSDLLKRVAAGDALMADKGFLIEKECLEVGVKLVRPPFLGKSKQLNKEEGMRNSEIARARAHVERVIQRIKIFSVCNKFPWSFLYLADGIICIICGLVNLTAPIQGPNSFENSCET